MNAPKKKRVKKTPASLDYEQVASPQDRRDAESQDIEHGESESQPLVWRAVFIGAATALILVLIPSYLVGPRLTRSELAAVDTAVTDDGFEVAKVQLPPFSAGLAQGLSAGQVLVAIPSNRIIRVFDTISYSPDLTENSPDNTPRKATSLSFVLRKDIPIDAGPVVLSTSPSLGIAAIVDNTSSDIWLLDLLQLEVTRSVSAGRRPVAVRFSDDYRIAAVANFESGSITLIDLVSYSTKEVSVGERPRSLAFFGGWLFVARENQRQLEIVDVFTATKRESLNIPFVPEKLEECEGWLIAADADASRIAVINPAKPENAAFVTSSGKPRALACVGHGRFAAGTDRPGGIATFALPASTETSTPTAQPVGFVATSSSPTFLSEISPGIVAFTGPKTLSSFLTASLISANLLGVLTGGIVAGVLARRRYASHALALSAVLVASYWLVFQGAQPAALPLVVVFVGLPVLATAALGTWIGKVVTERSRSASSLFMRLYRKSPSKDVSAEPG
ncbi:MAG: hypothetical protein C4318_02275 [Acidimicrobiia bacterium]